MIPGWTQILLVVVLALLLFGGRGRISSIMGDLASGITSFRRGLKDGEEEEPTTEAAAERRALEPPNDGEAVDVTPERDRAEG